VETVELSYTRDERRLDVEENELTSLPKASRRWLRVSALMEESKV